MRISAVETVTWGELNNGRGHRLEQRANCGPALMLLVLLSPAIIASILPVLAIGMLLANDPAASAVTSERAGSITLIALGFGVVATLLGLPIWRFLERLGARRMVEFGDGWVRVFDRSLIGQNAWACPMSEFEGLAQRVRTTLSGTRRELILVHCDRPKCILIQVGSIISDADQANFAEILSKHGMTCGKRVSICDLSRIELRQPLADAWLAA